ncbi:MAG: ABC transporter permease, partial [Anaerolineales bacterium]
QKMGTIELLLTSPVRDWELVVGKWLGGFLFLLTLVATTLIYPIVLNQLVSPGIDQGPFMTGYLGLILICAALISVGVTTSSLFDNQIAAFFATFAIMILLWIIGAPAQSSPMGNQLLTYLDFRGHYNPSFLVGVIDIRDIIYYLSLTGLSLFLGSVFVEVRRWR